MQDITSTKLIKYSQQSILITWLTFFHSYTVALLVEQASDLCQVTFSFNFVSGYKTKILAIVHARTVMINLHEKKQHRTICTRSNWIP